MLLAADAALIAPDLLLLELGNVLWKKVRVGDVTRVEAEQIAHSVPAMLGEIHPAAALVHRARAISLDLDHPIYDCVFLALAESKATVLVAADGKLAKKVKGTSWGRYVVAVADVAMEIKTQGGVEQP